MQRDTRPIPPTASGGAPAEISRSPQRASRAAATAAAATAGPSTTLTASTAQPQAASSNASDSASSAAVATSAASSSVPSPASGPLSFPTAVSSLFQRLDPAQSGSVSEEGALAALAPLFPRLAPNEIARWMREAQAKEQRRARRGSGSARGGKSVQSSPIMGPQPQPASALQANNSTAALNLPTLSPLLRTPTPVAATSSGFQRTVSDESVSSAMSAVSASSSSASSVGAPTQPSGEASATGATTASAPTAEPERLTLPVFARLYARLAHLDANPASAAASSASAAAASAASNPAASLSNQTVVLITSCMQNDFFHRFPRRRDSMNRYWVGRKDSERVLGFDPQRGPFSQLMNFIRGLQQTTTPANNAAAASAATAGTNVQLSAFGSASQSAAASGQNSVRNRDAGTTIVTSSPLTGSIPEGPDSSSQQQQQRDRFNLDSLLTTAVPSNTNPSPSSSDGSGGSGSGVGDTGAEGDLDAPLQPSSTPPPSLPDAPPEEEDDEYNHELEEAEDGEDHDVLRLVPQNSQSAAAQQQQQQPDRRPSTSLRVDLNAGLSGSGVQPGGASNALLPLTLNSNHYSLSPLLLPQRAMSSHSQQGAPTASPFLGPSSLTTTGPAPSASPSLSFTPSQSGGAGAAVAAQTPIHVIHLRTSIDRNKERGRQAIERYGEYCLMGTEGARLCGNIEENMSRYPTEHIIDTTRTLSSNSYRPLLKKLREIHGASKGPLRVAVIGGWTDEDVYHLCYELKTRTKAIEIATCSVLTASPSTSQHWNALGQMKRVIGVTLTRTVRELVQWFGVGVPASASSSLLPAFSHTRPSEKERYWPTFVWNTPASADGGEAGLPPKGFNPAVDGEILAHLYRNSSRIIIDIVGGSFTAAPNAVVLSIRSVDKATVREAPSVTKLARTEDVATEYQAFHRVEEMLGNNAPMVRGFVELADRAGIKFRYTRMTGGKDVCSMSELCTDLSTHYSTIASMIDEVYSEIFLPWYAGARLEFFDLFAYWFDGFTLSLGRVWNAVKKVDRVHCDPGYLQSFISYCLIRKGTDAAPPGKEDKDFYSFPPHTAATFSFPLCDPLTNLGALFAKPSGVPYLRTLPPQKLYACFSHGNARLENFMCEGAGGAAHAAPNNGGGGGGGAGLSSGNYSSAAANANIGNGSNGNSGSTARGNVWIVDFYYTESRNHCLRDLARTWCCLMYLSTEINNDAQFAQALLISAEVARARDLAVPLATQLQGLTDLHLRTIYSLLCRLWGHAARIVKERSGAVQFQMGLLADSMRFFLARARNIYAKRWALSTAVMLLESILLQEKRIHSIKPAWIPLADNAVLSAVRGKLGLTRCPGNRDFLRFKKHSSANDDTTIVTSAGGGSNAMVPLSLSHPSAVPSAVSVQTSLKPSFQMPLGRNSLASSPLMGATTTAMMPARLASPALRPLSMGAPSNFALLSSGGTGSAVGGSGGAMTALSLPRAVAARYSAQNPSLLPPNEDPRAIEALERAQVIHDQAMALKQEALEEAVEEDLKVRRLSINVAAAAAAASAAAGPSAPNSAGLQRDSSNESASGSSTVDAATVELRSKRKQDAAEEERKKEHARMLLEQEQERARYEKAQALRKAAGGTSAPGSFKSHHPLADEEAAAGADEEIEEEMAAADEAERAKAEAEALAAKQKMDRMLPLSSSSCDLHSFPPFGSGSAAQQIGASGNLGVPLNQTLSASFSSPHLSALLSAAALPAASNTAAPSSTVVPVSKLSRVAREVSKLAREGTTHVLLLLSEGDFMEMGVDKIELQRSLHDAGIKQLRVMVSPGPLEISVLIELVQVVMSVLCEVPSTTATAPATTPGPAAASTPGAAQPAVQSPAAASISAPAPAPPAENKLLLISKSGFHRGGTLAACVLCAFGLSVDRSIRLVRDARGARTLGRSGSEALIHKFDAAFKKYLIERVLQSGELFHSAIERQAGGNGGGGGGNSAATAASNSNASALPFGSPVLQLRDSDTPGGFGSTSSAGPGSNRSQIKIWPTKEQAQQQK